MSWNYVVKRVALFLIVVWAAASVNFFVPRLGTGRDPIREKLGQLAASGGLRTIEDAVNFGKRAWLSRVKDVSPVWTDPDAADLHQTAKGPKDGIRVRTKSASICQTDVNLAAMGALPFTMGHEFAGLLDDGTPVGIEPLAPCGHCQYCVKRDYHFCEKGHAMVMGIGRNGGMAEEVIVPERAIVPLPNSLDVSDACLIERIARMQEMPVQLIMTITLIRISVSYLVLSDPI